MSASPSAILCYGIDFGSESDDGPAARFYHDEDADDAEEGSPAWLAYRGTDGVGVQAVRHSHYDFPHWILARRGTVTRASGFGEVATLSAATTLTLQPEDDGFLKAYCIAWSLPYTQPRWLLASAYS